MSRSFRCAALSLLCAAATTPLAAEPAATSAPPAWQDGASVYLTMSQPTSSTAAKKSASPAEQDALPIPTEPVEAGPFFDASVLPATHTEATAAESGTDSRRLAPPSNPDRTRSADSPAENDSASRISRRGANFALPLDSLYTMLSALAIVIGAFLLCAWLLRRGAVKRNSAALPADVVGVLGRVPLAARQFAELLRVGNKLVLINMTPAGASTLTEVTDPLEVDRLVGLCQQSDPHSTTKAFEQVFRQMSLEPAKGGFLGDELPLPSLQSTMEAFRGQRGAAGHA